MAERAGVPARRNTAAGSRLPTPNSSPCPARAHGHLPRSVLRQGCGAALGILLAWTHARTNTPGRRLLEPLSLIPFLLSPYVGAIAWSYLAAPRVGLLNGWLRAIFGLEADPLSVYNRGGIVWVLALFFTPVMYLFVIGSLRRMDPALEESARTSGSSVLEVTRRITLPLVSPAILSGAILVFVSSAGEFGVPLALGSPFKIETMTTQIYNLTGGSAIDYNASAALSTVLAALTLAFVFIHRRIVLPRSYTTITGKGYRPAIIDLGRWRWAAWCCASADPLVAGAMSCRLTT